MHPLFPLPPDASSLKFDWPADRAKLSWTDKTPSRHPIFNKVFSPITLQTLLQFCTIVRVAALM